MQFELTKEFLQLLSEKVAHGKDLEIQDLLEEVHPVDIAEIFQELKQKESIYIYKLLEEEKAADVLVDLEEELREKFLETFTSQEIAEQVIDNIDSDDAADVISELSDEKQQEVIRLIEDREQAEDLKTLLSYPEDTAGSLMGTEMVIVQDAWTVSTAIREMRKQAEDLDDIYTVYVINKDEQLVGRLSLKKLLLSSESTTKTLIKHLYDEDIISVLATDDDEDVAKQMEKYDLVVIPVVDEQNRLIGRITIDDIVDVIKKEAERDYQIASGITEDVDSDDKTLVLVRARLPWLLIGLVGGVLVALVISFYEPELAKFTELAIFIPLIGAMAGNVGVQSSAIVVQGLANNSFSMKKVKGKLVKEFFVASINASILAVAIVIFSQLLFDQTALAYTVGIALFSVIIFASLFGTAIPILLDKWKIDPALATGPFITTINDILGLSVYFLVAKMLYGI